MSSDESECSSVISSSTEYIHIPAHRHNWTSDTAFGIVHPLGCKICMKYMSHVVVASEDKDQSFTIAVKERDSRVTLRFLDGIREGRRLQREHDTARINRYRVERDEAIMRNVRCVDEIKRLRDELEMVKDNLLAMEIAFDEAARGSEKEMSGDEDDSEAIGFQSMLYASALGLENVKNIAGSSIDEMETRDRDEKLIANSIESDEYEVNASFMESASPSQPRTSRGTEGGLEEIFLADDNHSDNQYSSSESSLSPASADFSLSASSTESLAHPDNGNPVTVEDLKSLMALAHEPGNNKALVGVRLLCHKAHLTPRSRRTEVQKYILDHWRPPTLANPPVKISSPLQDKGALLQIFVDASFIGMGFVMNGKWLAWKLKEGWKSGGKDISWGELVAVELGLRAVIAAGYRSVRLIVRSDNSGVVQALHAKATRNTHQGPILREILNLCSTYRIQLEPRWISTKENLADDPSRGVYGPRSLMFSNPPPLPEHLLDFIRAV